MIRFGSYLILTASAAGVVAAGLLLYGFWPANPLRSDATVRDPLKVKRPVYFSSETSAKYYDQAYDLSDEPSGADGEVVGVVVPHDMTVRNEVAGQFRRLALGGYDVVVVIAPDRSETAKAPAVTSRGSWVTPYGRLEPDNGLINVLVRAGVAMEEKPFKKDESVAPLVAFIKRSLPEATVVPILVRDDVLGWSWAEVAALALADEANASGRKTVVVASLDFSQEATVAEAAQQDQVSERIILELKPEQAAELAVESPSTVGLFLRYLNEAGAYRGQVVAATHTSEILSRPSQPGTSHRILEFFRP